jgi:DNA-binding NarL/FixJ family response regulator
MNYYQVDDEETLSQTDEMHLDKEYVIDILEASKNFENLTTIERNVIELNYSGKTIKEIAQLLNKNEKTLYAARNRAISKIRKENTF